MRNGFLKLWLFCLMWLFAFEVNPHAHQRTRRANESERRASFSIANPSHARKSSSTSHSTPRCLAHLVALSRSTRRRGFARVFHRSTPGSLSVRDATALAMSLR